MGQKWHRAGSHRGVFWGATSKNYCRLGGKWETGSSVQTSYYKSLASTVARHVRRTGKGFYFGAFYEPIRREAPAGDDIDQMSQPRVETEGQEVSRELLRQQVRDFADWLKAQGVI